MIEATKTKELCNELVQLNCNFTVTKGLYKGVFDIEISDDCSSHVYKGEKFTEISFIDKEADKVGMIFIKNN